MGAAETLFRRSSRELQIAPHIAKPLTLVRPIGFGRTMDERCADGAEETRMFHVI